MELTNEILAKLVAEVRLAPSVHNVQPARWHSGDGRIQLLGDPDAAIPVADPQGRDWRLSLGAQFEGLAIAAAGIGLAIKDVPIETAQTKTDFGRLVKIADVHLRPASADDAQVVEEPVTSRTSWRGKFERADETVVSALDKLQSERTDCLLISSKGEIRKTAALADRAALHFLRDRDHRKELVSWLRLSRKHPRYLIDGLNGEAMCLSSLESWGAGLVLGALFEPLDKLGLAAPLVNEASKTATAATIVLFHRPIGEDSFQSGRAFYRAWLAMERAGLAGCPMSVLADLPDARDTLARDYGVPEDRQIVSVFRIGRPSGSRKWSHARLPVEQLIV